MFCIFLVLDFTELMGFFQQKYRFEGSLVGLMVHSAHNESVFLIKQTSCKGKEPCRLDVIALNFN